MNDTIQDQAARLVEREVYYCVSSLMSSVLAHPEAAAELFDCDADDLYDLAYVNDYEGPAAAFIQNADEDELRELADVLEDSNIEFPDEPTVDDLARIRRELLGTTPADDKAICEHFDLDPDVTEVYEHWIVSRWLASRLEEHGECVGEFAGMTIWGRTTTGQSISMDHVIQQITEETMK